MKDRIHILLARRAEGKCSKEELEELNQWYESLEKKHQEIPGEQKVNRDAYLENKYAEFKSLQQQRDHKPVRRLPSRLLLRIAAVLILFFTISSIIFYHTRPSVKQPEVAISYKAPGKKPVESRYLKLPDSSIVILHAGSSLKMYDSSFSGKTREVALNGTAYFDVHHMSGKPFIIHIGKLKVTVLGTAFNIRQDKDSVAVTVTRGKVKVENEHKLIAILTPNQQVVYHIEKQQAQAQTVSAQTNIQWIKTGLDFNDESLAAVAKKLEERYGVHISFTNNEVANCRIYVTNPFEGTESVGDILSFICPIINATFTADGNSFIIDGKGCN